jgi:HSP20 family protein
MKATLQKEARPAQARPVDYIAPEVNIFETKDGYVLEAEMPGVTKEGLEITLEGCEMTIVGNREVPSGPGEVLFRESRDASFRRVFQLDPAIDTTRINARVEQGVLTLSLPKSERVKPRKISVD